MADVNKTVVGVPFTAAVNRYIFADADSGRAAQFAIQFNLNGGTATYAFQVKVPGETTWQAAMAYPVDTPTTGATSGTTSNVWNIDASGKQVALNVTAATGSPQVTFFPLVG